MFQFVFSRSTLFEHSLQFDCFVYLSMCVNLSNRVEKLPALCFYLGKKAQIIGYAHTHTHTLTPSGAKIRSIAMIWYIKKSKLIFALTRSLPLLAGLVSSPITCDAFRIDSLDDLYVISCIFFPILFLIRPTIIIFDAF